LKNAVLTSEDGSFFHHRGFNEDAFRQSIALNFTKGKFVRGGSTISMQLVKNVFLNRKKNISRKLEEALIVWLIENNNLCSKERMFEVYLNIIEWGPGIYGIKEASYFYFKKRPSDLNLAESIFLASIIPRPKSFRYSFDTEGRLKGSLAGYYRLVSEILYRKELISQNEFENLLPSVELKGNARLLVLPSDSLLNDSLFFEENKFME
jgi:membrane peptidoglycan carboxypeptidase